MMRITSEQVTASVHELPSLPAVVVELIQSMGRDDLSAAQLAQLVSRDQALSAKALRLANSSFYGMSRQIDSVADATSILGLRSLRSIALAAGVAGSFGHLACPGFRLESFWRHSIGTALCATALAQALGRDEEAAFTLGLLHDIGRLALASAFPAQLAAAFRHQRSHDLLPLDAERAVLGIDHAVVGGLIAEHWHFAPAIGQAIAQHHEPDGGGATATDTATATATTGMVDLLHVADNMAHALDFSQQEDDLVPPLSMAAWARLALNDAQCRRVFRQAEMQVEGVCQALLM